MNKYPYNPTPEQMKAYREHLEQCLARWIARNKRTKAGAKDFFDKLERRAGKDYTMKIKNMARKTW